MAALTVTAKTGFDISKLAPQGQYMAVCLNVDDQFGVMRTKYQSTEEAPRDVTRFLFGLKHAETGELFLVQTYEYTISALPNSNLMKFLTQWLGAQPQIGWDYCELERTGCTLTIGHKEAQNTPGKVYAKIMSIAPVMPQMLNAVPQPEAFAGLIAEADQDQAQAGGTIPTNGAPQAAPVIAAAAAAAAPTLAPPVAQGPVFPYGWTAHPQAPGQYYLGQEVITEADLRARFEPVAEVVAPPIAAAPPAQALPIQPAAQPLPVVPPAGNVVAPIAEGLPQMTGPVSANATSPSNVPAPGQAPPLQAGAPAGPPF